MLVSRRRKPYCKCLRHPERTSPCRWAEGETHIVNVYDIRNGCLLAGEPKAKHIRLKTMPMAVCDVPP